MRDRRSQADLASAAGVSLATLKRFEHGDDVGFAVVVKIALAQGCEDQIFALFQRSTRRSIDEILKEQRLPKRIRKRG